MRLKMKLHQRSIKQLQTELRRGDYSCLELTDYFLERLQAHDKSLNSIVLVSGDSAREQAKLADKALASGNAKPLTGIPIAHKDIFCTDGFRTSCASKMLDNFISPYNATVVNRMAEDGAIMLAKTNMDEFAMGSSNENSFYGAVKNPWQLEHTPGGSSGGSAACVAARLIPASTGTDTGGSIRQPAAFCGITGLKPTYGRVSRYGMVAFASSLDQAGPMTQTAEDAAILLQAMAGHDVKDSTSIDKPVPNYLENIDKPLAGRKIGVCDGLLNHPQLNGEIAQLLQQSANHYQSLGAELVNVELEHLDAAVAAYYIIAPAEASSNLARFDGVRYGYRCEQPQDLNDLYVRSRSEGFGQEVKRRIMIGTYALSAGYYDAYYVKAQKVRRLIRDSFAKALSKVDAILAPVTPEVAFPLGSKKDPISMYLSDVFTIAINLAGLPALSHPIGFSQGLPVGGQLIGHYFDEASLLNIAHQYQQNSDWHLKLPEQFI